MEDISDRSKQIQLMFDKISSTYDFLNRILSFGQDMKWRNRALSFMPEIFKLDGVHYDVACGTGDMIIGASKKRKDYHRFIGFDLSSGMLDIAQKRCIKNKVNAKFIQTTAEHLPCEDSSADCVTIAFGFRNMDNRALVLQESYRVLKPRGVLIILDFFEGERSLFSKFFKFYFKFILPKIGRLFADKYAYDYLPKSVSVMPSEAGMKEILMTAGFCKYIEHHSWLSGGVRLFVAKKH